jgi:hypothetical protein
MPEPAPGGADVIVDIEFDSGVFFVVVRNIGDAPATAVQCKFEQRFFGLGGTTEISALPLFRRIEFLAPAREIRTLLDTSAAYFARKEPAKLAVAVTWRDDGGERRQRRIVHDLAIYRALAYRATATSPAIPSA